MHKFFSLSVLVIVACSELKQTIAVVESIEQQEQEVNISLNPDIDVYHLRCMNDLVTIFATPGDEESVVHNQPTDIGNQFEGYYLDDSFVYPYFDEGCDIVECIKVNEETSIPLTSYSLEEERLPPPDDYEEFLESNGGWGEAPEDVSVITSSPLSDTIEIQLHYYPDASCAEGTQITEIHELTIE
jgi:hypothetical protein